MQEIQNLKTELVIEKISRAKYVFFKKNNKMNKPLIRPIKYKKRKKMR